MSKTTKNLVSAIKAAGERKTGAYDTQATVTRIEGGTAWVHIPGGVDETPCKLTINAKSGDVVQVRVSGGKAFMVGNASAPPTDDTTANAAYRHANNAAEAAANAVQSAQTASEAAAQAVSDAASAASAADAAQNSLKSVVQGATTVEKAVSVMQTALEAVVDYDPTTDTTKEYFWHDANGAHVLGDDSGYRNDIDSSGMKIVDVNTEKSVAEFSTDGINLSMPPSVNTVRDVNYLSVEKGATSAVSRTTTSWFLESGSSHAFHISAGLRKDGVAYSYPPSEMDVYVDGVKQSGSHRQFSGDVMVVLSGVTGSSPILLHVFLTQEGTYTYPGPLTLSYEPSNGALEVTNNDSDSYAVYIEYKYTETHAKYRLGTQLIADYDAQTVLGKYNDNGNHAFEIGNGTDEDHRSNALTVDWSGNVEAAGDVTDGNGNVLADKADASDVKEIIVASVALSSVTLTANGGTGSATGSVARTGYTPLGIVGVQKSGSGNGQASVTAFLISGTTATVSLYNNATASRTVGVTVYVLYKAS